MKKDKLNEVCYKVWYSKMIYKYSKTLFCIAEDKVKDRLAQLAREKLGILSKEKQIQLERKKRAMAFLNQINGKYLHCIV